MGFFFTKKDDSDKESLTEKLDECAGQRQLFQQALKSLLVLIKDFSFDIKELDADKFKKQMDTLSGEFSLSNKISRIEAAFDSGKDAIINYINNKKSYFKERENELKSIIDLLTKGLSVINEENIEFNQKIYDKSIAIGNITLLDDIKKIKDSIKSEVEHMQVVIREKQTSGQRQIEILTRELNALKCDLEKAQTASMTDGLTGAYNRLAMDNYLEKLVDKSVISNAPFALLMMDVDNFKKINDSYGHQIGDSVLVALIRQCKELIRKEDFLARYGGEEFTLILPNASLKNAVKKGTEICRAIELSCYVLGEKFGDQKLSFTISVGISTFQKGDTVKTVTERADNALYLAKKTGKNKVVTEKELK
ncbi:diguanylate cyclase [Candidatus Magnetominusculus xianensis]|uniref:diguanylate cyclase n=1 Tax=Candidatus Magnetominusculus xianensis TaxID=1748249 RepID=A0ABR5SFR0_9BACT|nr:diguanylate cyclase [Candidatus Magnetominusculus xianensis]